MNVCGIISSGYFREYGSIYCGNCANCLSQFEEVDVTEIARDLSGCVLACRQRYGTNDEYAVVKPHREIEVHSGRG